MYGQYIKVQSKYLFSNLGLERCRVMSYITSTLTSGVYTKFMQISETPTSFLFFFFLGMNSNEINSCSPTWTLWAYFLRPKFTSFRICVDKLSIYNRVDRRGVGIFHRGGKEDHDGIWWQLCNAHTPVPLSVLCGFDRHSWVGFVA